MAAAAPGDGAELDRARARLRDAETSLHREKSARRSLEGLLSAKENMLKGEKARSRDAEKTLQQERLLRISKKNESERETARNAWLLEGEHKRRRELEASWEREKNERLAMEKQANCLEAALNAEISKNKSAQTLYVQECNSRRAGEGRAAAALYEERERKRDAEDSFRQEKALRIQAEVDAEAAAATAASRLAQEQARATDAERVAAEAQAAKETAEAECLLLKLASTRSKLERLAAINTKVVKTEAFHKMLVVGAWDIYNEGQKKNRVEQRTRACEILHRTVARREETMKAVVVAVSFAMLRCAAATRAVERRRFLNGNGRTIMSADVNDDMATLSRAASGTEVTVGNRGCDKEVRSTRSRIMCRCA